jgi:uncharacterized protein (TIGR03086 family)
MAGLVVDVPDDLLTARTPCPAYTLGDLIEHIGGFAMAFTAAAAKAGGAMTASAPAGDASRLPGDWRARIPAALITLAEAWRQPVAWTGMTRAGGVDLPGQAAGLFALDELVVHGWDVAAARGVPYAADPPSLAALHGFVATFADPGQQKARSGLFGPVIEVPAEAPLLDRVIGLTGRDPRWPARQHAVTDRARSTG